MSNTVEPNVPTPSGDPQPDKSQPAKEVDTPVPPADTASTGVEPSGPTPVSGDLEESSSNPLGGPTPIMAITFKFSPEQFEVLKKKREEIQGIVLKKDHICLIQDAQNKIMAFEDMQKMLRKQKLELMSVTKLWFATYARRKRGNKKHTKAWTGHLVLYKLETAAILDHRKELFEEAIEEGENPRSDFYFHQVALSEFWDDLPAAKKVELKSTAKKWNEEEVDPQIRAK